jgi:hypothetical protein
LIATGIPRSLITAFIVLRKRARVNQEQPHVARPAPLIQISNGVNAVLRVDITSERR